MIESRVTQLEPFQYWTSMRSPLSWFVVRTETLRVMLSKPAVLMLRWIQVVRRRRATHWPVRALPWLADARPFWVCQPARSPDSNPSENRTSGVPGPPGALGVAEASLEAPERLPEVSSARTT